MSNLSGIKTSRSPRVMSLLLNAYTQEYGSEIWEEVCAQFETACQNHILRNDFL